MATDVLDVTATGILVRIPSPVSVVNLKLIDSIDIKDSVFNDTSKEYAVLVKNLNTSDSTIVSANYSIDNHIFINVGGDKVGQMQIAGTIYADLCDSTEGGTSMGSAGGEKWHGYDGMFSMYETNRLVGELEDVEDKVVYITPVTGPSLWGFVTGLSTQASYKGDIPQVDFTLQMMKMPMRK